MKSSLHKAVSPRTLGLFPSEQWLPVTLPGIQPYYHVSSCGRIVSVRNGIPRTIKPWCQSAGYLQCGLAGLDGKRKCVLVHNLVLTTFSGAGEGLEPNHIDGNKQNNTLSNLVWVTPSANIIHSWDTGLRVKQVWFHAASQTFHKNTRQVLVFLGKPSTLYKQQVFIHQYNRGLNPSWTRLTLSEADDLQRSIEKKQEARAIAEMVLSMFDCEVCGI